MGVSCEQRHWLIGCLSQCFLLASELQSLNTTWNSANDSTASRQMVWCRRRLEDNIKNNAKALTYSDTECNAVPSFPLGYWSINFRKFGESNKIIYKVSGTVMRSITTLRSTTDCIYDGGPTMQCNEMQYDMIYDMIWYMWCDMIWYMIRYYMIWYMIWYMIRYDKIR